MEEFYCADGTRLTSDYVMNREIELGITGCLCDDGIMPRLAQIDKYHLSRYHDKYVLKTATCHFRCRETGEYAKCPNGVVMDFNLGLPDELRDCQLKDW